MCCFIITAPAIHHFTISYKKTTRARVSTDKVHASKAFMLRQLLKLVNKS